MERAWQSGIQKILIPQVDLPLSNAAIHLAESDSRVYLAVGVHPNSAHSWHSNTVDDLMRFISHPKVVAIGEIGLDYYREHSTPDQQKDILASQLDLAAKFHKPVILHCRDAFDDLITILTEWVSQIKAGDKSMQAPFGVFHSFSGTPTQASAVVSLGFFLGINGVITYRNADTLRDSAVQVGLDHLLLETDAPFLAPVPHRGERNEPAYISLINSRLALLFSTSADLCAKMTYNNAVTLFKW